MILATEDFTRKTTDVARQHPSRLHPNPSDRGSTWVLGHLGSTSSTAKRALWADVIWEGSLEEGDKRWAREEGAEEQKTEVDKMGCTGGNRQVCFEALGRRQQGQKDGGRGLVWEQTSGVQTTI